MRKKLMALILSGIMIFQSAGIIQSADFSDGTMDESFDTNDNVKENFSDNKYSNNFSNIKAEISSSSDDSEIINYSNDKDNMENNEIHNLPASTADDIISGQCGENAYWTLKSGTMTITGRGEIEKVYAYEMSLSEIMSRTEKIVIMQGITSIGKEAFCNYDNLTNIVIPNSVMTIGERAFYDCDELVNVKIPDSVTTIGAYAFGACDVLTNITISDSITTIENGTFYLCKALTNITIPSGVTTIEKGAFEECEMLTNITIPNSVTIIGEKAFSECKALNSVSLPNSVTTIEERAFEYCNALTNITIPNGVVAIEKEVFRGCDTLTNIAIPNSVTTIKERAFRGCGALTNIIIPNGVTTIKEDAFYKCEALTNVSLPNSITTIKRGAFKYCSALTNVSLPNSVTTIETCTFTGCEALTNITIPDSVKAIYDYAFDGCKALTNITIPHSVTTIGMWAFYGIPNLTDVYYMGSKSEWENLGYHFNNGIRIHYNNAASSNDKTFKLTIYGSYVIGNPPPLTGITIDYIAFTFGNVENEEKQIKWSSSDSSIAEVDQSTAKYIDNPDKNSTHGKINLLTYDAGEVTITGTSPDGRIAEIQVNIEPKLEVKNSSLTISKETSVEVFEVKLKKANKKYLETFMKNLILGSTGSSISITKKSYEISEDGKTAKLILTCKPNGTGEKNVITCSTAGGQKISMQIGVIESNKVSDYDYSSQLDRWLKDEGTSNSMAYLSKNENFVNSMMVANYDSSFLDEFIENSSDLIYGGYEGWKNYWNNTTKTEQAREILAGLLTSYQGNVEEISMSETADKFVNIYISTLKNGNWAYATAYGLSSTEINKLAKLCNNENLSHFFLNKKYDNLAHYLQKVGGYSEDSKIIQCIKSFTESGKYAQALADNLKVFGTGLKVISLTNSLVQKYFDLYELGKANEMYCAMLDYLKNNCSYEPIKKAATDLYDIIKGDCQKQLEYLSKSVVDELENTAVEKILDGATNNISMVAITYKAYKYSKDLANIIFNTKDAQKQKDNMRCTAYIAAYLARWMQYNKNMYIKSYGEDKKQYAKETVFAYYMLLKTRIAGEKSGRNFMDAIKFKSGSRQYKVSLQITSTLESMETLLKQKNIVGNRYVSSTVSCPVDVEVCDSSGKTILTVYDGKESTGNVNGIYYNVFYHELDQDYVKIINFPENSGYTLKCKANDIGKVDYFVSMISDNGISTRKETGEIPVQKGNQIQITNISKNQPTCKLIDNKGIVKKEYIAQPENNKNIPVTGLKTDVGVLNIQIGEKVLANVNISPENATIKTVLWSSSDEAIARVNSEGVIEGVSAGNTIIKVVSSENYKIYTEIKVTVGADDDVPITPIPKPSTPILNKVTVTHNAITVNWNAVSDANGYQIYRKVNSGKWKPLKTTTKTSYKDKAVKAGYKYSYTVKAYRTENGRKIFSEYNKKGLSGKLNTSISLAAKNKTVLISWKKTTGAAGYYVYRSENKAGKFSRIKTTSAKTLKYTDIKVKEGGTYNYKVVPFGKVNNKNVSGGSSAAKTVTLSKKQTTDSSGYKFVEGINKIIPLLEEQLSEDKYYAKTYHIDDDADKQKVVSFQYRKGEQGMNYFSIVCQPDVSHNGGYIVLTWNEGEAKPLLDVYYIKDSDYNVDGYLSYQKKGNDYILDFTKNSTLKFKFTPKSKSDKYTLTQLNTMANETFHEVLQMLDSCMKQNMNMSIKDLGFKNY